jgi:hypothetical protein
MFVGSLLTALSQAGSSIKCTVNGCLVPDNGTCVGDFVMEFDVLRNKSGYPIGDGFLSAVSSKTTTTQESTIFGTTRESIGPNKTKVLSDFSGLYFATYVSHGQTLWPCSLRDGGLMPFFHYNASKSYAVFANFTQDPIGEDMYACDIIEE